MKTKVICDTNIWYYLGDESIDPQKLNDYCLVATFNNFLELNTSPKTVKNFPKVHKAAIAIKKHSCSQILENPILHLTRLLDPHFQDKRYDYNIGMRHWNEIVLISGLPDNHVPNSKTQSLYQQNIDQRQADGQILASLENERALNFRKIARKLWRAGKNNYWNVANKMIIKAIMTELQLYSNGNLEIQIEKGFEKIELFISAFIIYYKNLEMGGMVAKPNDLVDLYNLLYVQPGMLYFTRETRWIAIIEEAGMGHYLLKI